MTLNKNTVRRIIAGGLAAAALPITAAATATTAHAHTVGGCTVQPLAPIFAGFTPAGVKIIDYRMTVNCAAGRSAHITQTRYEADTWPNADDNLGTSTFSAGGVQILHNRRTLPNTELGNEEVYQRIRFHVHFAGGGVTANTGWHTSAVRSFAN